MTHKTQPKLLSIEEVNPYAPELFAIAMSWKYKLFLLTKLPMGFIAGLRVEKASEEECIVSVPYRWMNANPFKSIYFAVLCMAAELSTGLPSRACVHNANPSVSMLVTSMNAQFTKKAKGRIRFVCSDMQKIFQAVQQTKQTGEWTPATVQTIGYNEDGQEIARFNYEWSYRARLS